MSVVIKATNDRWIPKDPQCLGCDEPATYPFVHWMLFQRGDGSDLILCASCCRSIQRGLTADMMRCAAIERGQRELYAMREAAQ